MKPKTAPAVCAHRSPPTGKTVGMFRLIEAYIKQNYPDKIVLVITTETKERLMRLVKAGVTDEWTFYQNLNIFAQACDNPPGRVVMITCATREEAWALGGKIPNDLHNDIAWIFVNGEMADDLT